ncbi:hypothetical protein BRARA_A00785 [Brassica rapa]|uniref:Protein kinase domain-containing protein n=1 Tax=Brassica campestris TaxID=3711 RepID=A0A398AJK4_BRACM|nr:hypothetical protein BRARA_A00785 [Brassica rapa]
MRANRSLLLVLFCTLATAILVHGQTHTGYISIDCGAPIKGIERDIVTGISYTSDDDFITTGDNFNVSEEYNYPANPNLPYVLADVRAFPKGDRNCYSLKPSDATDNLYLIRASFMYGNYDGGVNQKALPEFDLYLNVNFWSTVKFKNASEQVFKEILTYTDSEFLYVCLVNKGRGTPFISGLELRPVNSPIYNTEFGRNISLVLYQRWDTGYLNGTGRYQNDVYDRIWSPYTPDSWSSIRTTEYIDVFQSGYSPPYEVINTAASPKSEEEPMELLWTSDDTNATFYAYLYFAEFETLETNESRKMKISWNGSPFSEDPFISPFEYSTTLSASRSFTSDHLISLQKTEDSTLPPMLNAIEIFTAQSLDEFYTATEEVQAMETIRSTYKVKKVWSGDPCAPRLYPWDGLEYLHQGCRPPIIHRDVKTANILLNDNLEAKIADFGVSKVFPDDDLTHVETAVMGTPGYIDPDFGIVLLELITGQRAIVRTKEGEKISVIHFVEPFLETGELDGVVDPLLQGDYSSDSAWKFVEVAMSCVRERGFNRPAMNQVVSELQQCLAAELAREPERSSEGNGDREVD